jgi:methionyl-tRNA formyltransferase
MRILFFGNNRVGWQILEWLQRRNEEIVGLVLHPPHKRRHGEEILAACPLPQNRIWDGSLLREPEVIEEIRDLKPDIGISAYFGYILRESILNLLPLGCINIHPAYLPYNRGANPNVWSIVDGTPAGVTIHYMDTRVDTGDIVSQMKVPVQTIDTGESLYHRLEQASVALFKEIWPDIRAGKVQRKLQSHEQGTHYFLKDVQKIDEINLDQRYKARDLINVLRARTFPPYPGAYFVENGQKIYMRLQLLNEEEMNKENASG